MVQPRTNISWTKSVLQSELLFGEIPTDVSGVVTAVFWTNHKLIFIMIHALINFSTRCFPTLLFFYCNTEHRIKKQYSHFYHCCRCKRVVLQFFRCGSRVNYYLKVQWLTFQCTALITQKWLSQHTWNVRETSANIFEVVCVTTFLMPNHKWRHSLALREEIHNIFERND
jgi:hypothetical protein